jgi:hypothetical protein
MTNTTELPGFPEWQVLCALATFFGLFGAATHLSRRHPEGSRVQASLRTFVGILLPPSIHLWLGAPLADWALAAPRPLSAHLGELATLALCGFLLSRVCPTRLRLQPFVLATGAFSALVLPLGWAAAGLAEVMQHPLPDGASASMAMLCLTGFLLPLAHVIPTPKSPAPSPDPDSVVAEGWLVLAWTGACLASSPQASPMILVQIQIAVGAALCGQMGLDWVRSGTVSTARLLEAPLAGTLATLPGAGSMHPTAAALCGLLGVGGSLVARRVFSLRLSPGAMPLVPLAVPAGLGLLLAPWFASDASPSAPAAFAPLAWIVLFGSLGSVTGWLVWHGLPLVVRLEPTPEETSHGMDYCDLGLADTPPAA